MSIETLGAILAWSAVLNMGILLWWAVLLIVAHDWLFRFHGRWFKLSLEKFDCIQYAGLGFYKLAILMFNIVPYLAIRIIA
ncbi:MAG: hypothetical protein ACI9BW_001580 [Gammaproteobacteria bacterium]|jgi:hypothetical protein